MKKIHIFLILFLFSANMFAQAATPSPNYIGVDLMYSGLGYAWEYEGELTTNAYPSVGINLFYDMNYLRAAIGYYASVGDGEAASDNKEYDGEKLKESYSFLDLELLAKYPFSFKDGAIKLWPALGLQYAYNLSAEDENGDPIEDNLPSGTNLELNDLYLLLGIGMDFSLSEKLIFTPSVLYAINLTPEPINNPENDVSYVGVKIDFRFGFGYKF